MWNSVLSDTLMFIGEYIIKPKQNQKKILNTWKLELTFKIII